MTSSSDVPLTPELCQHTRKYLEADIADTVKDAEIRTQDILHRGCLAGEMIEMLNKADFQIETDQFKIIKYFYLPHVFIERRTIRQYTIFLVIRSDEEFSKDKKERDLEIYYFSRIFEFVKSQPGYSEIQMNSANHSMKTIEGMTCLFDFSYGNLVAKSAISGVYFQTCVSLADKLRPIVIVFHQLMARIWPAPEGWMPIEKTSYLVTSFFQGVGLLPKMAEDLDVFNRDVITWKSVVEFESGQRILTDEYFNEEKEKAEKSSVFGWSIADVFCLMFKFLAVRLIDQHGTVDVKRLTPNVMSVEYSPVNYFLLAKNDTNETLAKKMKLFYDMMTMYHCYLLEETSETRIMERMICMGLQFSDSF